MGDRKTGSANGDQPWFGRILNIYRFTPPTLENGQAYPPEVVLDCEWFTFIRICPRMKLPLVQKVDAGDASMIVARDIAPVRIYGAVQAPGYQEGVLVAFGKTFKFMMTGGWDQCLVDRYKMPI